MNTFWQHHGDSEHFFLYVLYLVRFGMMHMVFSNYAFISVRLTMTCFYKSTHAAAGDERFTLLVVNDVFPCSIASNFKVCNLDVLIFKI